MRIVLNPSEPRRAKHHMEAAWHGVMHRKDEVHIFAKYRIKVTCTGDLIETEEMPR